VIDHYRPADVDPRQDSPRVLVPPPLIFASLLALGLLIESDLPPSLPLVLAGVALASAGLVLIVAALGLFRRARTRAEPWRPSTALVESGIYRLTRNPMYLGIAGVCFGTTILFASLPAALLTALALLLIDRTVIAREESYLNRRFGDDYRVYRSRTRRWL
jgi:protein-S-isoprenylcysteine O-methyltransferase Ste14